MSYFLLLGSFDECCVSILQRNVRMRAEYFISSGTMLWSWGSVVQRYCRSLVILGSVKHRFPVASAVLGLERRSSSTSGLNLAHYALCENQWCFRVYEEQHEDRLGTADLFGLLCDRLGTTVLQLAPSSLLI